MQFKKYIDTLHVEYFYDGEYPKADTEAEFAKWMQEVEQFIRELEAESSEAGKR